MTLALGYQRALDVADHERAPACIVVRGQLDTAMRLRAWEWFSRAQAAGIVLQ